MKSIRSSRASIAHPAMESDQGMCLGGHPLEAEAGTAMLAAGGNAMDAAVAACFMGYVVEQLDCGLGGFVHLSAWDQSSRRFSAYDGYVRAPKAARPAMFSPQKTQGKTYYGHPPTVDNQAKYGPLAVAVPGAVAALCRAHQDHGRLTLKQVLEPAIGKAEQGVAFTWRDRLVIAGLQEEIRKFPDTAQVLLPGGALPQIDVQFPLADRMDTLALAHTLKSIANQGEKGFYQGRVAETLGRYMKARDGILSREDLEGYRPKIGPEPPRQYRGNDYITCFDSVAYEALNILDQVPLQEMAPDSADYRHLMAETLGIAFTDNIALYGDPDFVNSPLAGLTSREYAALRRKELHLSQALSRPIIPGDPWAFDPLEKSDISPEKEAVTPGFKGTSQMVAADREGNMVSIITAIGWDYASLVYVPELGIFLNNGMSYFDPRPGFPNSIAPGKMPMFGAPALILSTGGRARFAAAGSGGYRIATGVLHSLLHSLDYHMPMDAALNHPRIHCQGDQTFVDSRISPEVTTELKQRGHDIVPLEEHVNSFHFGRVCALSMDPKTRIISGSASPHWMTGMAAL